MLPLSRKHMFSYCYLKIYIVIIKQDWLSDWEDSWKMSGAETEDNTDDKTLTASSSTTKTTAMTRINNCFLPGWSDSWLLAAAAPEEAEEYQKNWSSGWGYWQQIRWVIVESSIPDHCICLVKLIFYIVRSDWGRCPPLNLY